MSYTLHKGDCLEYMKSMPDNSIDLVVTDPPYGINENNKKNMSRRGLASPKDYGSFGWDKSPLDKIYFDGMRRISLNQIIFGGNYYRSYALLQNPCLEGLPGAERPEKLITRSIVPDELMGNPAIQEMTRGGLWGCPGRLLPLFRGNVTAVISGYIPGDKLFGDINPEKPCIVGVFKKCVTPIITLNSC